jgi:hypothetical protein
MSGERTQKSPEMERFSAALRGVMQVSKDDLNKLIAQDRAEKVGKPKRGPKPKPSV